MNSYLASLQSYTEGIPEESKKLILNRHKEIQEFHYIWTINDLEKEKLNKFKKIETPIFTTNARYDLKWRLILEEHPDDKPNKFLIKLESKNMIDVKGACVFKIFNHSVGMDNLELERRHLRAKISQLVTVATVNDDWFDFGKKLLSAGNLGISCLIRIEEEKKEMITQDLSRLLKSEKLCDVKLVVENEEFPAHKVILAARSPIFAAMFENDTLENQNNIVEIEDTDPKVVKALLDFIYAEKIDEIDKLAPDLFIVADKFDIENLKNLCFEVLINRMSKNNVVEILVFAYTQNSTNLFDEAREFIRKNINHVKETAEYKALSEEQLQLLNRLLLDPN